MYQRRSRGGAPSVAAASSSERESLASADSVPPTVIGQESHEVRVEYADTAAQQQKAGSPVRTTPCDSAVEQAIDPGDDGKDRDRDARVPGVA